MYNTRMIMKRFFFAICIGISLFFLSKSLFFQKGLFIQIPVEFESFPDSPLVSAKIEDTFFVLKLDWGLPAAWTLRKEVLEKINQKKEEGTVQYKDIKGKSYFSRAFRLPQLELGKFKIASALGIEEDDYFIQKGAVMWSSSLAEQDRKNIQGKVGREAFKGWNLLFDFPKSALYLTQQKAHDFKQANSVKVMAEGSFEESRNGTVIVIETDIGPKRFMLDTGASHSILRKSAIPPDLLTKVKETKPGRWLYTTERFSFGNINLGPLDLFLFEFTSHLSDIDGILGVDFFRAYPIYLDFQTKVALILYRE